MSENEGNEDFLTEGDDGVDQLETFAADDADDEVADESKDSKAGDLSDLVEDPELEAIKARVREMEEEAEKLKEMQSDYEKQMNLSSSSLGSPAAAFPSIEEKIEADARSIYVGNVDYGATAQELEAHFHGCGSINRVTILCDKFTGHPKGFAYIEFADKDSIQTSVALDESLFRGRQIKVTPKRTNRPGITTTDRGPPRGRYRRPRAPYYGGGGGYVPRRRPSFRPRRSWHYAPY